MHVKLEEYLLELGLDDQNPPSLEDWHSILAKLSKSISEDEVKTADLEKGLLKAELHSAKKREFLASMSHEIRTPLSAIVTFSQLLTESSLTSDQSEDVSGILTSATHLQNIISNILDFSKIEAGKFELDCQKFSLPFLLKDIEKLLSGMVAEKGIVFHLDVSGELPRVVMGDSARIKQVLINLLGNAIKFTTPGGAVLLIVKSIILEDVSQLSFSVVDTGMGIPKDKCENIFEHFSQGNNTIVTNFGGTGLGLPISKDLASLMGGEITVNSREKIGSVFKFSLKLPVIRAGVGSCSRLESIKPIEGIALNRMTNPKILVVDDNLINRTTISRFLNKKGFETRLAGTGFEALNILESEKFNLILMDIHLPQMSGFEVSELIRKSGRSYQAIPIIAISADVQNEIIESCQKVGINGFFAKPLDFKDLIHKMNSIIAVE